MIMYECPICKRKQKELSEADLVDGCCGNCHNKTDKTWKKINLED